MCDFTMALMALGTGMQVFGQVQQGDAAQAQANYQAAVDRRNADIADYQSREAISRGEVAVAERRKQIGIDESKQIALLAANGIDVQDGSSLDIIGDTNYTGELDALAIRDNARREAFGHEVGASNYLASAGMSEASGRSAKRAGTMGAFTTLATGAAKVKGMYDQKNP